MRVITMGSLFDGIGGFPLAAIHNGVVPLWASEIEPFPIRVTRERLPGMLHYGDITKLRGDELPPVDIICGGSPCQDLSVAGARAGLAGECSGLFMEQIRIIKEMRDADVLRGRTGIHVRPRFMCWENVPGAFSSGQQREMTSGSSWRKHSELVYQEFMFLKITLGDGDILGQPYWEILSPYVGESSTLNTGVCPRVVRGSSLWQILEPHPQRKYYLSRKACLGILRRARKRGKELPATLKLALEMQSGLRMIDLVILAQMGLIKAYHINQRNEGIDLGDTAGALMATSNLQMQTFVAGTSVAFAATSGMKSVIWEIKPARWVRSRG